MKIVLEFVKKRYLLISVILVSIGLVIDLYFNEISLNEIPKTVHDLNGNTVTFGILTIEYTHEMLKIASNLCYGLAVSLIVLISLELKYDDLEREKTKIFESQERIDFTNKITELQEKININIFDGVLKKLIPSELFDLLTKDVLSKNIIRQNAHWMYDVTEGESNNYVVNQTIIYELKNIGRNTHLEPLKVSIPLLKRRLASIDFFKVEKNGITVTEFDQGVIAQECKDEDGVKLFSSNIILNADEVAKVTINIRNQFPDKNAFDVHSSNYSVIGLTIHVNKPEDCNFVVFPNFTSKLNITRPNKTKIVYEKIPGILVGQGLSYSAEQSV